MKSRDAHPPGGWRFLQPQTNWRAPEWQSFTTVVAAVISHRRGNPILQTQYGLSIDQATVENEVDAFNAAIAKANGWTEFYSEDDAPVPFPPRPYIPPNAGGAADHVRKTAIGIKAISDWLGAGLKPVDRITAENRAVICANCPENQDPDWFQKLDAAGASLAKGLIEAKNQMQLVTTQDSKLNTCQVCDCWLRLKVWVEKKVAQDNTPADIRAKLPAWCWILKEAK